MMNHLGVKNKKKVILKSAIVEVAECYNWFRFS